MKLHERGLAMSKILIVEDEESIADIEKDYLELNGYEVEVCNDGTSGCSFVFLPASRLPFCSSC